MARQNQGDRLESQSSINTTGLVSALSAYNSDVKIATSELIKRRLSNEPLTDFFLNNGSSEVQATLGYGSESVTIKKPVVKLPCDKYNENEKMKLGYVTYESFETGFQEGIYAYLKLYDELASAFEDPAKIRGIVADVISSVTYILNKSLVNKIISRIIEGASKTNIGNFAGKGDVTYNLGTISDPVSLSPSNAYSFMQNMEQVIKTMDTNLDSNKVSFIVSPGVYKAIKSNKTFVNAAESGLNISSELMSDNEFKRILENQLGKFYPTDALPYTRDDDGKLIQTVIALKPSSFGVQVNQVKNEIREQGVIKGDLGTYLLIAYAMRVAILNQKGISVGIVKLEGVN